MPYKQNFIKQIICFDPVEDKKANELVTKAVKFSNAIEAIHFIKNDPLFNESKTLLLFFKLMIAYRSDYKKSLDNKTLINAQTVGEILVRDFPWYPSGVAIYLKVLNDAKEYEKGVTLLENKCKKFLQYENILFKYCKFLIKTNQKEKAEKELTELCLNTQNYFILYTSSVVFDDDLKQLNEAEACLQRLLELAPNHWPALLRLAYIYGKNYGDYEQAIKIAEKCLKVVDKGVPYKAKAVDKAKIYNQLAICYQDIDYHKAKKNFKLAIAYDPNSPAQSGLNKLIRNRIPALDPHHDGLKLANYETLRQHNPKRFDRNHGNTKEIPSLVQVIPQTNKQIANKNSSTTSTQTYISKNVIKKDNKNMKQHYLVKLNELTLLLNQHQNDNSFNFWFETNFVKLKNGTAGKFVQAQRIFENGNPSKATEMLAEIQKEIVSKKNNKSRNKKSKNNKFKNKQPQQAANSSSTNKGTIAVTPIHTQQQTSKPSDTIHAVTASTTSTEIFEPPILSIVKPASKSMTSTHSEKNSSSSFSQMRSFLSFFSDCCPTFFTKYLRVDQEENNVNSFTLK